MEPKYFQYLAQEKAVNPSVESGSQPNQPSLFAAFYPLIMILLVFAFLYFFSIRPQRKEEKRKKELISSLKKGDVVVTHSGIVASIHAIKDDTVILKAGDNARIEVLKSSIYDLRKKGITENKETEKSEKS